MMRLMLKMLADDVRPTWARHVEPGPRVPRQPVRPRAARSGPPPRPAASGTR